MKISGDLKSTVIMITFEEHKPIFAGSNNMCKLGDTKGVSIDFFQ